MNNRRLFPLKSAAGSLWQHWQEARIHLPILQGAFLYASGIHRSQGMSISLGRAGAMHIPTSKARRKTLSMPGKLYVLYTDQQYEQLARRNSAALIAESHAERARQLVTESRVLIAQVRSAIAESKVLRAKEYSPIGLARR